VKQSRFWFARARAPPRAPHKASASSDKNLALEFGKISKEINRQVQSTVFGDASPEAKQGAGLGKSRPAQNAQGSLKPPIQGNFRSIISRRVDLQYFQRLGTEHQVPCGGDLVQRAAHAAATDADLLAAALLPQKGPRLGAQGGGKDLLKPGSAGAASCFEPGAAEEK
jgi:hypothetical protein